MWSFTLWWHASNGSQSHVALSRHVLVMTTNRSTAAWFEMYYDDKMDYIYCLVSKASCTSWKRTLMMLTGKLADVFRRPEQVPVGLVHNGAKKDKYVARIQTLPQAHRTWRFDSYFTFLFVREPLERLVSAYRDKVPAIERAFLDFSLWKYRN